jgi:hypothetical protein
MATVTISVLPAATPAAGTVTAKLVPLRVVDELTTFFTSEIAALALEAHRRARSRARSAGLLRPAPFAARCVCLLLELITIPPEMRSVHANARSGPTRGRDDGCKLPERLTC